MMERRRYRGLLIGNAGYPRDPHALPALNGPLTDIMELRQALTDAHVGLFDSAGLDVLPDYGIHDLRERVDELFTTATRGDVLLLYYSGHGQLDERGTLYLCAKDTKTASLRATALSAIEINNIIDGSPATSIVIILDCCYSGAFKGTAPAAPIEGRGRYVLTSSRSTQLAQAATHPSQPSPFTQQLVRALRTAPPSKDAGHLTVVEIYQQVHHWMTANAVIAPQLRFAGEGDMALARRPAPPAPPQKTESPSTPRIRTSTAERPRPSGEPLTHADAPASASPSATQQKSASPSHSAKPKTTASGNGRHAPADTPDPVRKPIPRRAILVLGGVVLAGGGTAVALLSENDGAKQPGDAAAKKITVAATDILRCPDVVSSVAFSPDGKTLAAGGDDHKVRLWNVETGKTTHTLTGPLGNVFCVAFSPDGKTLATGGDDHKVRLWNVETGKTTRVLTGHTDAVNSVAFGPYGKTLATGSEDGVRLWNVATGAATPTLTGPTKGVKSVAFSPDGKTLSTGGYGHKVRLWNMATRKIAHTLTGHTDAVTSVAFSPDGKTLSTGSYDHKVRLWNVETGKTTRVLTGHTDAVTSVAFGPYGKTLATGSADRTVRLWNVMTGKITRTLTGPTEAVESVAFSPDRKTLAAGNYDKTVRLWSLS